jgi:hypothetical protein
MIGEEAQDDSYKVCVVMYDTGTCTLGQQSRTGPTYEGYSGPQWGYYHVLVTFEPFAHQT